MGQIILSARTDPAENLALEETLLFTPRREPWLYLWCNRPVVVIGRNQNPYLECSLDQLEQTGVPVVRRLSGGGAVYHDLGNLNYTFFCPEEQMDIQHQTNVIRRALEDLGITATFSGRNDLLVEGRKISGAAYYTENGCAYHHGTLLIDVDLEQMAQALTPSGLKLKTKSISSVRQRVANLKEINPNLTMTAVAQALMARFQAEYGAAEVRTWDFEVCPPEHLERYRSAAWNLGDCPAYDAALEVPVAGGVVRVMAHGVHGAITKASLSSDLLEALSVLCLEQALTGCLFTAEAISERLEKYLRPSTNTTREK